MTEYELNDVLCAAADDFLVDNEDLLPLKREDITDEMLDAILEDYEIKFTKEARSILTGYLLDLSKDRYDTIIEDCICDFRDDLERVISNSDDLLPKDAKLKVLISVANDYFCNEV